MDAFAPASYVATLTSGGINLLRDPLVVGPGGAADPIEVTLRNDAASLTVTVQPPTSTGAAASPDAASANDVILAIPLDDPLRQPANGMYSPAYGQAATLSNLAPGRYLVLAAEAQKFQQFAIEYRNPTVLDRLLTHGAVITLSPNQKAEITVPLTAAAQDAD